MARALILKPDGRLDKGGLLLIVCPFKFYGDWPAPDNSPVQEFAIPDAAPSRRIPDAPFLTMVKNWGDIRIGHIRTTSNDNSEPNYYNVPGGLYWDENRNALWWTYGTGYVPVEHHPNVGATILDDKSGTYKSYGPWRTGWHSMLTQGAMGNIPASFAAAYTNGKTVGLMGHQSSGNVNAAHGAVLSASSLPDPISTPPDAFGSTHSTIESQGVILHDVNHRQVRDNNYKVCDYKVKYECSGGATLTRGDPIWSSQDPGAGETDTMCAYAWVDLPDKHGLLYFGQLATTPTGYVAPNDPDGLIHRGYAALTAGPGNVGQCCHGQDDPFFQATGPWAHARVPMGFIYNPDDLIVTAQQKAELWSRTPTSVFQWRDQIPEMDFRYGWTFGMGAHFDAASKRVYVTLARGDKTTIPPSPRPVLMVFEVS